MKNYIAGAIIGAVIGLVIIIILVSYNSSIRYNSLALLAILTIFSAFGSLIGYLFPPEENDLLKNSFE